MCSASRIMEADNSCVKVLYQSGNEMRSGDENDCRVPSSRRIEPKLFPTRRRALPALQSRRAGGRGHPDRRVHRILGVQRRSNNGALLAVTAWPRHRQFGVGCSIVRGADGVWPGAVQAANRQGPNWALSTNPQATEAGSLQRLGRYAAKSAIGADGLRLVDYEIRLRRQHVKRRHDL